MATLMVGYRGWVVGLLALLAGVIFLMSDRTASPVQAATGDHVATVNFSVDCTSGLGVGIAFDGVNLWYTCFDQATDLYKANPATGQVIASYNVVGGLGALAWDNTRLKLWAGTGCAPGQIGSEVYLIDPLTGIATLQFNIPNFDGDPDGGGCLDDGLAYDGFNDTIYHSWDGAVTIRHLSTTGVPQPDDGFPWGGDDGGIGCFNSGLAIGGSLLYQGSDGCSHVWVVDKVSKAAAFDFTTIVAGDPNFRDEDLECDNVTFALLGKEVMWSKEAHNPRRAHAFEVPAGSCLFGGGLPPPPPPPPPPTCPPLPLGIGGRMTGSGVRRDSTDGRVTDRFQLHCPPDLLRPTPGELGEKRQPSPLE